MNRSLFLLAILLAHPGPSFTEPSGKLGCRFSPLCNQDELCAEDKLFGTCTHRSANLMPSYDLDPGGLRRLKDVVQYLLDQGFAWEDQYAQDSLHEVLTPFKQNFIPLTSDLQPEAPSTEETDTWAKVDRLARAYKTIMDEYKDRYLAYKELVNQYGFGDNAELNEYAQAMQEKYDRILRRLQREERENLRKLYNLYYEEYLRLLKEETAGPVGGGLKTQGGWEGTSREDSDWKGLHKIQLLKEYLQLMYNENRDRWVTTSDKQPESEITSSSSSDVEDYPLETFQGEWKGDFGSEVADGDGDTDGVVPVVGMETGVADSQEEEAQGEDIWDTILGDVSQEYWNSLNEDQKNQVIDELLQLSANNMDGDQDIFMGPESQDVEPNKEKKDGGGNEHQDDAKPTTSEKGDDSQDASSSKGQAVGQSSKEFVEPLKQPKESGINLDVNLAKKDKDAVAVVTPQPSGKEDVTQPVPTTSKATTFAPGGFVFIALQSGISLSEAKILVEELANALDAPDGSFTEIETGERQITFRVNPDVIYMTPAEVAEAAASHQADLESMLGVTITETGVGKQTHITVLDAPRDDNPTLIVVTVVLVACIVGILIAVITVYCYRQKARIKAKFKALSSNGGAVEGEATADYQDLCRQRMASKSSEKPEPLSRISSVAMSEGAVPSPSSRSSTSSWSEEPVQSNMDISTGHIVLAYMEDHLRNKDRITKEWEALCRYEPDISSTKVGALAINSARNRYQDVLPYDHTRVLLNDSTNALSSDYINASTIADADPRNPAYIATQAPLPATVADFWQMVWEQGIVVIVNLTPMTDSDTVHTLYWPTEGGTRYHFYEVHLVSEHVWCEDYLVRSFYLKNTETQETRTVTQFHFLTWPENGMPPTPKALLEFRRKVNKSYRGKACPIVVHCSDGVGRTGTYCLVDMVLTRMTKGAKEIDIAATLEHIRDQRPGAVKLKEQFEFALTALAEEVNAILKALPQ